MASERYAIRFTDDGTYFGHIFSSLEEATQQVQRFWRSGGRDGGSRHLASAKVENACYCSSLSSGRCDFCTGQR